MIDVHVVRDSNGFIWQYSVAGHALFDEAGKDIVCSAVSVVAFLGINALMDIAGIDNYSYEDGYLICSIPSDIPEEKKVEVRTILETVVIGFRQVELTYSEYVRVLDEEV